MHPSAEQNARFFFQTYCNVENPTIVEIGSQIVNKSIRDYAPSSNYIGLDFVEGKGVDIVLTDAYKYPIEDNTADFVVTSSCFEHAELFWLSYLEAMRILKPTGVLYINVPSTGPYHRYPVDCWRFYPDSGLALNKWGRYNNYNCCLLESYATNSGNPEREWNDLVSIHLKDETNVGLYTNRILNSNLVDFRNGYIYGSDTLLSPT